MVELQRIRTACAPDKHRSVCCKRTVPLPTFSSRKNAALRTCVSEDKEVTLNRSLEDT